MKVLHVIWSLGPGGAQVYLLGLLKYLCNEDDVETHTLVLSGKGPLSESIEAVCDQTDYVEMKHGYDISAIFRLVNHLRKSNVDIVHSHSANLIFNLFLQFMDIPVVYTEHGGGLLGGRWGERLVYKLWFRPIRVFVAISKFMAKTMENENPSIASRIQVICNGISPEEIAGTDPIPELEMIEISNGKPYSIGFIGRLINLKGLEYFLEAARLILLERQDVVFLVIGTGSEEAKLKSLAKDLGIADDTVFLGYKKDAIRYLKSFDVMMFTSKYEGFGLVLIEAMAAETPLVAMDIRGPVSEIIRTEIDGFVVDGANPKEAANAVLRLLDDTELRKRFVAAAKDRALEHFTISTNAKKVFQLYTELV